MPEKEFVFSASIDLRWFTPRAAQKLLDIALQTNLVTKKDGEVSPNFNVEEIEVPLEFKPSEDILEVQIEDLMSRIVTKLSESGLERSELVARINTLQQRYGLEPEVAGLMLGNDLRIDLRGYIPQVEQELRKRAKD